jgi:hypothetical protein
MSYRHPERSEAKPRDLFSSIDLSGQISPAGIGLIDQKDLLAPAPTLQLLLTSDDV